MNGQDERFKILTLVGDALVLGVGDGAVEHVVGQIDAHYR
jgi:hypothetical protein